MHDTLFILGNGFDLAHGLPTKYCESNEASVYNKFSPYIDFAHFLGENYSTVYDDFVRYACDGNLMTSEMWAKFEELFSNVDDKEIVKHLVKEDEELAGDDEHDEISNHLGTIEARISGQKEMVDHSLKQLMANALCDWILSLDYNDVDEHIIEMFSHRLYEADCLTFNYSHTLEKFYANNDLDIFHIHGTAEPYDPKVGSDLIFGHGDDGFSSKDIEDGSLGLFREIVAQSVLDDGTRDLKKMLRKKVEERIPELQDFLSNALNYKQIYIVGHSFGGVDIPYFEEIARKLPNDAKIIVSYYGEKEQEATKNRVSRIFKGFNYTLGDLSIKKKNNIKSFWHLYYDN
jgi:hypothetical protein